MTAPLVTLIDLDGPGAHPGAWVGYDGSAAARTIVDGVRSAERAGFTAAVFDDHPLPIVRGRPDGLLRAAFSAPLTGAIGLLPGVHALYAEPFHLASQLASLDIASAGRAGWIVGADPAPAIAARFGRTPLRADEVDDELVDVVEAIRRLWDSWEDDAVIRDVAAGRYLDRERLHPVDFRGRRFSVAGPAIVPRPPQGQPVTIAAAGTRADVDAVLIDAPEADPDLIATRAAEARARHPGAHVVVRLEVVLDRAGRLAQDRLARLDDHAPWVTGRARYVGDAPGLIHLLERLAVDGVRFVPAETTADLDELGRAVLPALRAGGRSVAPRVGDTARTAWGLPHPANRFVERAR